MGAPDQFTSVRFDQASPTVFYVGKAVPGKTSNDQAWLITRYTQSATGVISEFSYDAPYTLYKWTDRLTINYV